MSEGVSEQKQKKDVSSMRKERQNENNRTRDRGMKNKRWSGKGPGKFGMET